MLFTVATTAWFGCGPTQTFGSIDGLHCTRFEDEVCSAEGGFPRARCDFDGTWHILEHCGDSLCIVDGAINFGHVQTHCGNTPVKGAGDISKVETSGQAALTDVDASTSGFDSSSGGDAAKQPDAVSGPVQCGDYTCTGKQMCSVAGACEDTTCALNCKAGERCGLGVCTTYCFETCFSDEFCQPSPAGDTCVKMGCVAPTDLGAAYLAVGLHMDVTPIVAGLGVCGHLSGAKLSLNASLAALFPADVLAKLVATGTNTLLIATLPEGNAALLGRTVSAAKCATDSSCAVELSKHDNLSLPAPGGTCPLRWLAGSNGRFAKVVLPLAAEVRLPLIISDVAVAMASNGKTAELCGYVDAGGLAAAKSVTPGLAKWLNTAVADVDTNGDGKADAWSVHATVDLKPAKLSKWLP